MSLTRQHSKAEDLGHDVLTRRLHDLRERIDAVTATVRELHDEADRLY